MLPNKDQLITTLIRFYNNLTDVGAIKVNMDKSSYK